ncbi:hypothetical protein BDN71DRAFT_1484098 [Pleurotus eryngii]|uniref:Uncharacterized protein n=1 Tax=Pleurotus eryngii TaxID=5323 RepID=A0A9P5ZRX6_PLEER|nr:hypothetical protein BDN71DRAFT_1484098 [Pleurotus eryngii]
MLQEPNQNFRRNAGVIYIVVVHRGIANNQNNAMSNEYGYRVTAPSTLDTVLHYPATGSGIPDGENWYSEYQRNFTRILVEHKGAVIPTGVESPWEYHDKTLGPGGSWSVNGLRLFKTQDFTIFPVTMKFEAWGCERNVGSANTDVSVDFKFTA